ncbi:metallophosphoesterase [Cellvibrio japonicus]|uniref:Serine/threonine protein phosphatase n=1 Tax=Cellvibrio japonicus (strain Ueda107) TaxID=498211 RepID=B3PJ63_CELJU|nr:metallophosphoesterase [Cellvibrio japonicus]ACE83050.1 serine/threonine protein phosphatase [Cellvibrio japonicus Ueda107]QEI12625.1 serine/threonine protein phosphatase [Cellvibrio japonicus]QEI16199.1 serine/threonine protein phosphatase [Cellvibrio japonicus]QEI19777.1 serine/threonine protein phosphatase [Cellvibrio japonicus]
MGNQVSTTESSRWVTPGAAYGYDLIGDVHGCAQTLERLLQQLGYKKQRGTYFHPKRQAIFLGDVVDRGPRIREALHLVRDMVERGNALMILGNHEVNAITYCTPVLPGVCEYLRPHIPANTRQIAETLEQFARYPQEWADFLNWFVELPLFAELSHPLTGQVFRAVHACWDQVLIDRHRLAYGSAHIDMEFLRASVIPGSEAALTKQRLTGGIDLSLPEGMVMTSPDGYTRRAFRTKFWATAAHTYGELLFQPDPLPDAVADAPISPEHRAQMLYYASDLPPLFVGHYWLKGRPEPLTPNLACLDYSAVKYGRLVAYRMDGEAQLDANKFSWVYVDP